MAVNETVYGSNEVWTKPYGEATSNKNSLKVANWNTAESAYTRIRTQMYTYSNPGVIFNNWDNRQDETFMDMSIVPFGIGGGSGLSNIDWFVKYGSTVNDISLGNQDKRQITNIAYVTEDDLMASTWCLDGTGQLTGGIATAYTYYQHISRNRWSSLYGTEFSTATHGAGGSGSGHYDSVWNPCRIATYLPTKNIVLTPSITAINSSGSVATYTKISDLVANKSTRKLLALRVNFSYKPTGTRTNLPIKPFFFDDTNVQKGFNNYPKEGGVDVEVNQTIKLPIIQNASGIFTLLGTAAYDSYIEFPSDNTHHYTFPVFQSSKLSFAAEVINNHLYYTCDISQMGDDELREAIMEQIAFLGMLFVDDVANVALPIYDDNMYLGEIKDGITTGNYTHGSENLTQHQMQWDDYFQSEYNPYNPPKVDPNTYGVGMHTNAPWMTSPNRLYSINSTWISSIVSLYNSLWKCYYDNNVGMEEGQTPPTEFNFNEFLTVSPIDTIVSLKLFPYDTKSSTTNVGIRLGKYATGVNAYNALLYNVLDFGTVAIYPYFGDNWKDRETKYTLYAPFCGTLELDPAFYMGHTVGLEYWIDQVTGACTAALYITDNDNAKVYGDTVSGICAVDVPITGLDQATIQSQIFNANQQLKNANVNAASGLANAAMGIVASAAMGNAVGAATAAISGISNLIKNTDAVEAASYNLQHNKMSPRMIGAASPLCSMLGDWIPRIIVSIPIDPLSDAEQQQFSEIKGYSCIIPDKLGNHSGYVQAVNLKIVPPDQAAAAPTEEEVELIKSLVASGIYI